jgi:hypothetical protein
MSRFGHAECQQGAQANEGADCQEDRFESDDVDQHSDQRHRPIVLT